MSSRSLGVYLAFVGFLIVVLGIFLCWSSAGATQQTSFDSPPSAFSGSGFELLVGAFVILIGAMLLLSGLLSGTHRRRIPYSY